MRCYIDENAVELLNDLLKDFFKANSTSDNMAYALQSMKMYSTAKYYHEHFAHVYPQLSDILSGVMDKVGARAVRKGFDGDTKNYDNIVELFFDNVALLEHLRERVLGVLEALDYDIKNKDVCLVLEDISKEILELLYEANKVFDYAEYYYNKGKTLEFDFKFDDTVESD